MLVLSWEQSKDSFKEKGLDCGSGVASMSGMNGRQAWDLVQWIMVSLEDS